MNLDAIERLYKRATQVFTDEEIEALEGCCADCHATVRVEDGLEATGLCYECELKRKNVVLACVPLLLDALRKKP